MNEDMERGVHPCEMQTAAQHKKGEPWRRDDTTRRTEAFARMVGAAQAKATNGVIGGAGSSRKDRK